MALLTGMVGYGPFVPPGVSMFRVILQKSKQINIINTQ